MKYLVRSLKYLLFLCVLYVALVWLMYLIGSGSQVSPWLQIEAQLHSSQGLWMVVAFVALALFYPSFGFMRSRVDGIDMESDAIRIINAMQVHGFRLDEEHDGIRVFRADTFLRRLLLMYEDRIEVRSVEMGVELVGLRRSVARVAYQLKVYAHNSRFESNE